MSVWNRGNNTGWAIAGALAVFTATSWPATIPILNASFEEPSLPAEGKQSKDAISAWILSGAAGVFVNNGEYGLKMEAADGMQMAYLNGGKASSVTQDATPRIEPGTTYVLTARIGLRKDTPLSNEASLLLRLQAFDTNTGSLLRTLAVKEVIVGRGPLSDATLTEYGASFTSGPTAPHGGLRVLIGVGETGKSGDWTVDQVRLEARAAAPEELARVGGPPPGSRSQVPDASAAKGGHTSATLRQRIGYNRQIKPILSENCFACHGPDSASRKAGLRLDRPEDATEVRKGRAAIVRGNVEKSELVTRIMSADPDEIMPPPKSHKSLTAAQKALLKDWIASGAEYELHWAYLTPERPELPSVRNKLWERSPIDRFILATLEREGLQPTGEAERRALARRLSLDLTGLPPSVEEVEAFVKDESPDAYEKLVDHYLNSNHWGEHRARYWLDAARYADTHGIHFDNFREVWAFRDWVIQSFNANMPFDRFTIEQLAGDLLPEATLEQRIASGFNRCNITSNEGGIIDEEYLVLYTRDRTETTSAIWLATTANCATCHDHKFDPLTTREFYEMSAFFNNSGVPARDGNRRDAPPTLVVPTPKDRARWDTLPPELSAARERVEARRVAARPGYEGWRSNAVAGPFDRQIPVAGLELHAPLNEGSGAVLHLAWKGQVQTVTLSVEPIWGSGFVGPRSFKSSSNYVASLPEAGDFDTKERFSCGAWIKLPEDNMTGAVAARMDEGQHFRGWDLFVDQGRPAAHLVHRWPEDGIKVVSKEKLKPGQWTHVLMTYDGSAKADGLKFYVNGKGTDVEVKNKTLTNSIRTTVAFKVGQRDRESRLEKASIQDLRIYDKALASEEAQALARWPRVAWLARKAPAGLTTEESDALFDGWLHTLDDPFREVFAGQNKLEQEESAIRKRGTVASVMTEKAQEPTAYILYRGEYDKRRDRVLADTPDVLPPLPDDYPRSRLGLARWLFLPNHPLTSRVAVNRFWQELFGTGLTKTAGDFGVSGETPSHPELLDWLAVEFRESGWDVKRFFKMLVMSATYRQASELNPESLQKDPQNRLLSRGPRFRMDGEMVRDYALAASGLLVPTIGGPSVKPYQPDGVWEAVAMPESDTKKYERDTGEKLYRRSLYTFWKRSAPPASMDLFNAPNRETCTVRRERTNTPLQALATLNDPQYVEAARHLAQLAMTRGGASAEQRLDYAARRLLARPLRAEEERVAKAVLEDLLAHYRSAPEDAQVLLAVGESKVDETLSKGELAAYTMAFNQLMNLDEVLNK